MNKSIKELAAIARESKKKQEWYLREKTLREIFKKFQNDFADVFSSLKDINVTMEPFYLTNNLILKVYHSYCPSGLLTNHILYQYFFEYCDLTNPYHGIAFRYEYEGTIRQRYIFYKSSCDNPRAWFKFKKHRDDIDIPIIDGNDLLLYLDEDIHE